LKAVIVSNKKWHVKYIDEIEARTGVELVYISAKEDVTFKNFSDISPKYIFFPHWSHIIPAEVYENFNCVIFHMTDLPFGRGGSPLQNLIAREIYETKLSAIRCVKELDAGEIYLKCPLSLWGGAEEIYLRAAELSKEMMIEILSKDITPKPQEGKIVKFNRRRPADGDISELASLEQVFDYVRMLDADTYPKAFLETDYLRLEFCRAALRDEFIEADVKISLKGK